MKNLVKTLNGYNKNKVYKIKDQKEVIDEIVDFCQ